MSYIFVGGVARSGTTLLYSVLCSGKETNPALYETPLIPLLLRVYRETRQRFERVDGGQFFDDLAALRGFFTTAILDFVEPVRRRYGSPPHLVLKSNKLTHYCFQAIELIADCRVAVSVRDPRDVVASRLEIAAKERRIAAGQHTEADIWRIADDIAGAYESCLRAGARSGGRLKFVRYEDLVTRPSETVGELAAWAGLDLSGFDPVNAWDRSLRDFDADRATGSTFITEHFGKAISDQRIGQYRRLLHRTDVRRIEAVCGQLMSTFGYAPDDTAA